MAKYGLTPQGPNPKRLDVILEDMHSKMTERLGVNTRQNPQSLLNHTLTNVADEIAELWEFGVDVYHSQYTSSATGVSLDYAAQFGGSTREMAAKSYYSILCTGLDGTTIPAGTVIASDTNPATSLTATADATITRSAFNKATVILASPAATTALGVALNGNLYTITPDPKQSTSEALEALGTAITDKDFHVTVINDTIVIEAVDETSSNTLVLSENLTTASVGSIVTFETAEPGDIFIPNGVITKITKAVPGMESVVNVGSYVAGQLAESDVEFRKSYTNKIAYLDRTHREGFTKALYRCYGEDMRLIAKSIVRDIHAANGKMFQTEYEERLRLLGVVLDECSWLNENIQLVLNDGVISISKSAVWTRKVQDVKNMVLSWKQKDTARAEKLREQARQAELKQQAAMVKAIVRELLKEQEKPRYPAGSPLDIGCDSNRPPTGGSALRTATTSTTPCTSTPMATGTTTAAPTRTASAPL